mmetsp:Transcript_14584/g.30124  ORF Transcript_14584/g.30124 Transcript_14584/m.30124 type:complete len:111 (-) Transcript_14584:3573-3905(-)
MIERGYFFGQKSNSDSSLFIRHSIFGHALHQQGKEKRKPQLWCLLDHLLLSGGRWIYIELLESACRFYFDSCWHPSSSRVHSLFKKRIYGSLSLTPHRQQHTLPVSCSNK